MSDVIVAAQSLSEMSAQLRALPKVLDEAMLELAAVTRDYLDECYARGEDPDGNKWPVRADGKAPQLTGNYREVIGIRGEIRIRLRWYNAMHDSGDAVGRKQRRMVPAGEVPPELLKRLHAKLQKRVSEALK